MKRGLLLVQACMFVVSAAFAQTWTTVADGVIGSAKQLTEHDGKLFILTGATGPYMSDDGTNWSPANTGIEGLGMQGSGISSADGWLYYGSKNGLYRSNDNGSSWTLVNDGLPDGGEVTSPAVSNVYKHGDTFFCNYGGTISQTGGIYRSDDGATWTESNAGIATNTTVYDIVSAGGNLYAGTNLELYKSTDNGINWVVDSPDDSQVHRSLIEHGGRFIMHTTFGIEYSEDGGASWSTSSSDILAGSTSGFVVGASDTLYAYTGSTGVFYTTDAGDSWVDITGDLSNNDVMFMGGLEFFNGYLYLSTLLALKSNGPGETTTSVSEIHDPEIEVFPNPFTEVLNVRNDENTAVRVSLVNLTGQVVYTEVITASQTRIDTSDLPGGIYMLVSADAATDETFSTKKVVKH